jgi:tRNA pseudouridine38-40 synthase
MAKYKLIIEYDGTAYVGWQRQLNGKSVQGAVEEALSRILQAKTEIVGAGRTDSGVHARGQVAHFSTSAAHEPAKLSLGLNALLPEDIAVLRVEEVPEEFHARYSARERRYSYTIALQPTALGRHYAWHVKYPLPLEALQKAAEVIVGEHSFMAFCKGSSEVDNFCCTIAEARWTEDGSLLRFHVAGNRFLHGMVRALVGSMVDVARGYRDLSWFQSLLEKELRSEAGMAAPACGLVLEEVVY